MSAAFVCLRDKAPKFPMVFDAPLGISDQIIGLNDELDQTLLPVGPGGTHRTLTFARISNRSNLGERIARGPTIPAAEVSKKLDL